MSNVGCGSDDGAAAVAAACANNNDDGGNNDNNGGGGGNEVPVAIISTFSNDHLLKYECYDKFSTASKIKQYIQKQCPPPATQAAPAPLFAGLTRVGKNPSSSIVYFNFDTAEHRAAAKAALDTVVYRGKTYKELTITKGDLKVTHRGQGRTAEQAGERRERDDGGGEGNNNDNKGAAAAAAASSSSTADGSNNLAPWSHLDYAAQIERKADHCKRVLSVIARYHAAGDDESRAAVASLRDGSLFDGVVHSPALFGYRNNVQLSSGHTRDGTPTLGFNAGALVEGQAAVLPPAEGRLTSHPAVEPLAQMLQQRVIAPLAVPGCFKDVVVGSGDDASSPSSSSSSSAAFDPATATLSMYSKSRQVGFWRRVQFRFNADAHGECMIDIEVNDTGVPAAALDVVRDKLRRCFCEDGSATPTKIAWQSQPQILAPSSTGAVPDFFTPMSGAVTVTSLQWHFYRGTSVGGSELPREVLLGQSTLREDLAGLVFDLSPSDFFQVNRAGMELLIRRIQSAATLRRERTTLLDLCSGTGTLGLAFAGSVRQVVGIELVATAVENANRNAARNNIANARFICGKVEDELPRALRQLPQEQLRDVVAILDPPRCGVNVAVLKALRNVPGLSTIVYISCDQRALEKDCEPLTKASTGAYHGAPFIVTGSFGVDLFPHTSHVEMIVVLKRAPRRAPAPAPAAVSAANADNGDAGAEAVDVENGVNEDDGDGNVA